MFKITKVPLQVFLASCLYLGQLAVGFSVRWSGANISKLQDLEESPLPYVLSETQASLVASLLYIGGIPGPYLMGWLSNVKGRKPCLLLSGVFGVIGYILLAISRTLAMLYCARLFIGLCVGSLGVMILVYVGEIASTNIRGVLLTVIGVFNTCGSLTLFSVGSFLSYHTTAYVGLALMTMFTLCALMITETPIYHVVKGNDDALKQVLQDLGRLEEINKLIESQEQYKTISNTQDWKDLITRRSNKKALFTIVSINILSICNGVVTVMLLSSSIFKNLEFFVDENIVMLIITCFELFGSVLSPFFIDKLGRKSMLKASCVLCSLSMFIMGLYFYLLHIGNPVISTIKWLPLVVLVILFVAYNSGFGIIPHVLIAEMFTPNTRSNGSAVAVTTSWLTGFLVTTAFGSIVTKVGIYVPFWFFAAINALSYFFTAYFIPETKGKDLLEIQEDFDKS